MTAKAKWCSGDGEVLALALVLPVVRLCGLAEDAGPAGEPDRTSQRLHSMADQQGRERAAERVSAVAIAAVGVKDWARRVVIVFVALVVVLSMFMMAGFGVAAFDRGSYAIAGLALGLGMPLICGTAWHLLVYQVDKAFR